MRDNPSQRPRIEVPRTGPDYAGEALSLAGALTNVWLLVLIWADLPDQTPRQFFLSLGPDAWSGRWSAVIPIGIALTMYIGLTLLKRVPHAFNYPWPITEQNARIQYRLSRSMLTWLKAVIVWMFVAIVWSDARVAAGAAGTVSPYMIAGFLIAIHAILFGFIYRLYTFRHGDAGDRPASPGDI